ncbi:MAG: FtsH protease activity modulator HflK [Candidatus Parabeggiatoa sp. nov. 2]|nr:MAG: HflK protein [Beggiatoa sp. 4572_84]RKZ62631.1 MAG: FtsH protease activity modulator HflK [Gammaproteobacteria bacterium]
MAWNEPGGDGKDPWGGHRKKEQGPPDLDEIVKKVQDKLSGLFGGGNSSTGSGDGGGSEGLSWSAIGFIAVILLVIWGLFGFYTVQPAELGVITRFGRFDRIAQQGLNWRWPYPVEQVQKVNVEKVRSISHKALMLTKDENIVEIEVVVQYSLTDAKAYLFEVLDTEDTLRQATESALREVVGTSNMDAVLTSERTRVAADTKKLIQEIVNRYQTGQTVSSVSMQNAQPPAAVKAAFDDVIKAREDQERSKNKAHAYANEVVEKAKGDADQLREQARGYKAQVIARSEGETRRFLSILKEYERAPQITRQRLYLESMESVLSNTSKVMVDVQGGNNLLVLPLNQLLGNTTFNTTPQTKTTPGIPTSRLISPENMRLDDPRNRGGR